MNAAVAEAVILASALLFGHAAADALLQPPALSSGKRSVCVSERWRSLGAHGAVHGFFVAIVLCGGLGVAEAVAHALIDRAKGRGLIGREIDQVLHIACKALWLGLYLKGLC